MKFKSLSIAVLSLTLSCAAFAGGNEGNGYKPPSNQEGQKQDQFQGQSQITNTRFNYRDSAATAYAPTIYPTAPCFKAAGIAGQSFWGGLSIGGGKIDENCALLETARSFLVSGSKIAYCKVMLQDKYTIKSGVTMDDCMAIPVPVEPTPTPEVTPTPTPTPTPEVTTAPPPLEPKKKISE